MTMRVLSVENIGSVDEYGYKAKPFRVTYQDDERGVRVAYFRTADIADDFVQSLRAFNAREVIPIDDPRAQELWRALFKADGR